MNNLSIIIKREYWVRVQKRSFILTTLLTPIGIALFYGLIVLMAMYKGDETLKVAVLDQNNIVHATTDSTNNVVFHRENATLEALKTNLAEKGYDGILQIPAIDDPYANRVELNYYSDKRLSIEIESSIENWVENFVEDYKMNILELDSDKLDALKTKVRIDPQPIDETTEDKSSSLSSVIGLVFSMVLGLFMFMVIMIYGNMVMRGVMEEKMNRIVEVMISSVRPFELMLGKIIGIGLVGLTQMGMLLLFVPAILFLLNIVLALFGMEIPTDAAVATTNLPAEVDSEEVLGITNQILTEIQSQNWLLIIPSLIFFFLGGYFMFSALFAAIGSAIGDDMAEAQTLTLPISIPIMIAFYITVFIVIRSPDSAVAVWSSIFPLFSPIVMPARLAFDPPVWQVILSIVLLLATALFLVWVSARIYRVGILLYGKKNSLKEVWKWMFYKG